MDMKKYSFIIINCECYAYLTHEIFLNYLLVNSINLYIEEDFINFRVIVHSSNQLLITFDNF